MKVCSWSLVNTSEASTNTRGKQSITEFKQVFLECDTRPSPSPQNKCKHMREISLLLPAVVSSLVDTLHFNSACPHIAPVNQVLSRVVHWALFLGLVVWLLCVYGNKYSGRFTNPQSFFDNLPGLVIKFQRLSFLLHIVCSKEICDSFWEITFCLFYNLIFNCTSCVIAKQID